MKETNKENGCIFYNFHLANKLGTENDETNLRLYCIMERWESQKHLNDHLQTPHVKKFFEYLSKTNWGPKPPGFELFVCNNMIVSENELESINSKL